MTKATIRKCDNCEYQTMIMKDKEVKKVCRHCKSGLLIIIARGDKNE
jgi:hypothetical protein